MSSKNPFLKKEINKLCNDPNFIQLNDVPDKAIVICNLSGIINSANVNFCELIGFELNELIGKYIDLKLFSKIGFLKNPFSFNKLLNEESTSSELQFFKANETNIIFEIKSKKVTDKNVALFLKDVTKQRNLNIELQTLTNKLENLNDDKSRFISVLAHDLKSPFNSILGFIELLKENYRDCNIDVLEKYISYIEDASKNTYNLLEDTLEWISSENGKLKIDKENHEVNSLILSVLENYNVIAKAKNINIYFEHDAERIVFCDGNMIKTVLRNLLSNAIKFTNKNGEIRINIKAKTTETEISIADNGIGITEEIQSGLFGFNGFHSSEGTEHEKGTGMGLLLCKEFITKHNGKLSIESKVGVGSTFTFTIPAIV